MTDYMPHAQEFTPEQAVAMLSKELPGFASRLQAATDSVVCKGAFSLHGGLTQEYLLFSGEESVRHLVREVRVRGIEMLGIEKFIQERIDQAVRQERIDASARERVAVKKALEQGIEQGIEQTLAALAVALRGGGE